MLIKKQENDLVEDNYTMKITLLLFFIAGIATTGCQKPNNAVNEYAAHTIVNELDAHSNLAFLDVLTYGETHRADEVDCANPEAFLDFDFIKSKPSNTAPDDSTLYYVCSNNDAEIIRVDKNSIHSKYSFHFNHNHKRAYSTMHAREIRGFFLLYEGNAYFISSTPQPRVVMKLDKHLNVIQTIRSLKFDHSKFYYKTSVNYLPNNELYAESFVKLSTDLVIDNKTLLNDVIKLFDEPTKNPEMELKIGGILDYEFEPLWVHSGVHEYDYTAIQNEKYLELDLKERIKD